MTTQTIPTNLENGAARGREILLGGFLVILTLLRFWYDSTHELIQDEAYYWQWSRHLDWGYYDNTPLMAPIIRFFTLIFGSTQLGVRAGATVCALVATAFIYLLAKRVFGQTVAIVSALLACCIPLFAAGAVLMTQDPVQLAFWSATAYTVYRALTNRPRWWIAAGVLAGLTAQAKLNGLLILPSVFLYILLSKSARETWLRRPEPYVAGVIALVVFAPFLWWNHTHQNAFWTHIHAMGSRSTGHDGLKWLFRFLGDQLLLISPLLFLTYLYSLYAAGKRGLSQRDDGVLYLWCLSVMVFAATIAVTLRSKVEANWAVAAYITGLILVAEILVRAWRSGRVGRSCVSLSGVLAVFLAVAVLFPSLLYGVGLKLSRPDQDRTNELSGWRVMGERITQEKAAMGGDPFVFGLNYRMPSEAAFYLPNQPQTYSLFLNYKASEYMFWEDPNKLQGRSAIFLNDTDNQDHFDDLRAVFTRIEPQPPLLVYRNPPYATPIRTVQIVRCYGFKGYDVKKWQDGW